MSVVQKDTINSKKPSMKLRLDSPPTLQLSDFSTDLSPQLSPVMPILSPLDAPVGTNIFIKVTDTKLIDNEPRGEAIENPPKGVTNLSAFMCTSKRANTPPPMYSGPPKSPRSPRNSSPSRGDVYSATSIVQHVDVSKKDDKSKRSSQKKGQKQMIHLSPRDMKEVAQYKTSLRIPAQLIQGKTRCKKVASKKALKFEKVVDKKGKTTEDEVNKHDADTKRDGESKEHKKRSRRTKLVDRPKIDTTEFSIKFAKTFGKDSQKFLDKISEKLKPRLIEPSTPPKSTSTANAMTSPSSTSKLSETSMEDLENSITVGPSYMQGKGDASSIKPQEQVKNTVDSLSSSWPLKSSVSKEELKLSSSTNSPGAERNIWSSIRVQNRSRPPGKKYDKSKYKLNMKLDQEKRFSKWEPQSVQKPAPNEHRNNTQPETEETNINDGFKDKSNESSKPGMSIPTSRPAKSKSPRRLKGMSPLMRNVMQMRKDLQRQMSPQRFRSLREQSGNKSPRGAGSISKEDPTKPITGDDTAAVEPSGDTSVDADDQPDEDGNTRASYDSSNHSKRKQLSLDLSAIGRKFKSDKFKIPEFSPSEGSGISPKSKGFSLRSPKDQQSRLSPRSPMLSPRSPRISPRSPLLSPRSPRRLISSTKPGTPLSPSRLSPRSPKLSPRSPKLSPRSPKSRSPRFRRARAKRMLNELRNSAGFVPETKRRRRSTAESLFADPSELDREQRWLQIKLCRLPISVSSDVTSRDTSHVMAPRTTTLACKTRAMMQFSELESVPHSDNDSDGAAHIVQDDHTTNETHEEAVVDNGNILTIAPRKRGRPFSNTSKKAAEIRKKAVLHSRNADAKAIHDKRLQNGGSGEKHNDASPNTGQKRRRSSSSYHKDSAYETSLEKEQNKLETLRRQRNERKLENLTEPLSISPPKALTSPSLKSPKRSPGRKKGSSKTRIADLTGRLRLHLDKRPVYLKSLQLKEKASSQSIDEIIEKVSSVQTQEEQDAPSEPQPSTSKQDQNVSSDHYGNLGEHSNSGQHGNIGHHSNLGKHNNPEQQVIPERGFSSSDQQIPIPARLKQINVNSSWGETVLHKAARLGHEDVTLYCLKTAYQDVNARDNAGYTPLHECCVAGQLTIAKYLIAYGANVNVSSQDGIRPIHDAVENDMIEIVRLLLSCGADPTLSTYSGRTPQKIAKTKKMKDFLKGYFADLNGCDKSDKSIHWHFKYTKTDKHLSGFDIFDDVPSDPEEAENPFEEEGGMLFDFFDKPHIPSYSLKLPDQGLGNYILLEELIKQLQLTNESFRKTYPDVSIYTMSLDEMSQRTKHSPIMTKQLKDIPKQKFNLELVRLDARVNDILGVTTESVYELKPYVPPLKVEIKPEVKSEVFNSDEHGTQEESNNVPEKVAIKTEVSEDGYASDRTEIYENDLLVANGGQLGSSGRECQKEKQNGVHDSDYDVSEQEISLDSDSDHDGEQSSNKVNKSSDSLILDSETGVLLPDEQPIELSSSSQVYGKETDPNNHIHHRSNKPMLPGNVRQTGDHKNIVVSEYEFKDTSKKNGTNNLCDTSSKRFGFDYTNSPHPRTHKNTNVHDSQLPQSHKYGNAEALPHLPQSHGISNVSKSDVSSKYNIPMTQQSVSNNMTEVVKHPSKHQDEPLDFTKTNSKISEKTKNIDRPPIDLHQPGIQSGIPFGNTSSITTGTRNTNQDMNVTGYMNAFVASTAQRSSANASLYHNQNQQVGNHSNQIQQHQERYKQSEPLQSQSHHLGGLSAHAHAFPKEDVPRSVKMMMKQYQHYKDHQQTLRTNDYLKQHLQNKERQAQLTEAHEAKRNTELQKQKEQYMDRTKQVLALQRQKEILQRRVHHTEMVKQESLATERKLQAEFARNTSIHHAASIASHQSPVSYHSNLPVESHHSQLASMASRRQSPMGHSHPSSPLGSYGKPYPHSPMGSMHQGTLRPGHSQSPLGSLRPKSPIVPAHAQSTLGSIHAMSPMGPAHSQSPLDSIHRHSPMGSSFVPSPLTSHHRHSPMSALSSHTAPVRWPHGNQALGMQNSTPDRSPHVLPRMPTLLHVPSPDLTLAGGSMHELHAQAGRDSGPQTMPKLELSHLTQGPYRATPTSQSPFTPQYGSHRGSPSGAHRYPEGQAGSQGNSSYASYGSMGRPTYHQGHTPESDTQGKRYTYL
ncbi:unnamed protein product [Owenia fusiformis]|uniref:BCL-6 corepressor PCGF1 binding domain-containing protein n=1 Tax=Owenia fusiformis TaxID=6347 RepID=A0A8S4NIQ5_OWEFU|nr:unnamed protein product [Owenia fusiformis]